MDDYARQNDYDMRTAAADEDTEWQRVNSYIADILKDCYVLYSKLARLRGDFAGSELSQLDSISTKVRDLGQNLSVFSKAFTEGEYSMNKKEQFGDGDQSLPDFESAAEDFDFGAGDAEGGGGGEEPEPEDFSGQEEEVEPEDFEDKPKKKSEKSEKSDEGEEED